MKGDQLHALLEQVDEAVSRADLAALIRLADLVEAGAQGFNPAADPQGARRLAERAGRLAIRLEAARRGVQSARRRLSEIRAACELRTYDRAGQAQSLTAGPVPTARRF